MGYNFEHIQKRISELADPNNPYSQDDFNKEFYGVDFIENDDYFKIKLNFVNKSNNKDPEYATSGSSGFDLRASLIEPFILKSGETGIIPTDLYFEIPPNFEIQIRPRSGLAAKNSVTVLNSPGTIDSDYRDSIKVILINHGKEDFKIENGDRIAQAIVASVISKNILNLIKVDTISSNTDRGLGGLGSTGLR